MLLTFEKELTDEERVCIKYIHKVIDDRLENEVAYARHILQLASYSVALTAMITKSCLGKLPEVTKMIEDRFSKLSDEDVVKLINDPESCKFQIRNIETDEVVLDLDKLFRREIDRIVSFTIRVSISAIAAASGCSLEKVEEIFTRLEEAEWKDDECINEEEWEAVAKANALTEKAVAKRKKQLH